MAFLHVVAVHVYAIFVMACMTGGTAGFISVTIICLDFGRFYPCRWLLTSFAVLALVGITLAVVSPPSALN